MSTPPPATALMASFVNLGFRLPEGSVVVHAAVPRRHLDDIVRGFGLPPAPTDSPDASAFYPPLVLMAARRWPEPAEPDRDVLVEAALAFLEDELGKPGLPITARIGARLAGLLQTLTERSDLRTAVEEHL